MASRLLNCETCGETTFQIAVRDEETARGWKCTDCGEIVGHRQTTIHGAADE